MSENITKYESEFSEDGLWNKIKNFAKKAGCEVIEKVVLLYTVAKDPDTPAKAKALIYGSLGYFILPLDAIPDVTPFVGFTDDLGALVSALTLVAMSIKSEHKQETKEKIKSFGC